MRKKMIFFSITLIAILGTLLTTTVTLAETSGLIIKRHYWILTKDLRVLNLYRYSNLCGKKDVPIIFVAGWTENYLIFDSSNIIEDRSIARYLAEDMRDVWVIDLRTHDTDGDPGTATENEENMIKYWDFDKTYVKKDMVAGINFIKQKTGKDSFVLGGHSMGGLLSLAYAQLIGQENLDGIITIATPGKPMPLPPAFQLIRALYCTNDGHVKLTAPINFDPNNNLLTKLMLADMASYDEGEATEWWLTWYLIGTLNDEPAGVCCDLWWGLDSDLHQHWVDPDGYDYTEHMSDIIVPFLSICGNQDEMVPPEQAEALFAEGLLGSTDKTGIMFDNYGHVDLLIGKNAPNQIYPAVRDWLNIRFN